MKYIEGPDFPLGGIILGTREESKMPMKKERVR